MIRQTDAPRFPAGDTLPLYRVRALWECYGAVSFIRYYMTDGGSVAALFDGQAIVHATAADREELCLFLIMQPDVTSVLADTDTVAVLAAAWGSECRSYPVMQYAGGTVDGGALCDLSPRVIYALLQPIFPHLPPFDVWYPDVCYRVRHGACRIAAVCEGNTPVSCAMTTAEWTGGALLGCVATATTHRRQGLAARCVTDLVAALQREGRDSYICPKNEGAERLYRGLGFEHCGTVAQTERN